jgi:cytidine deaminase
LNGLTEDYSELVSEARRVLNNSYSPYSKFRVGAALQGTSGRVYSGTNVENASLGLSICAERSAVCQAIAAGERSFTAIAVCADTVGPTPPCGACRQVLLEFAPELTVVLADRDGAIARHDLRQLLAHPFSRFPIRKVEDE